MKKVMLIAYHFPPVRVSSGLQRTLSFARDLREHGWLPMVLSIHPRSFSATSDGQMMDIPSDVDVVRALGWDTARHLSINGKYWGPMALPDRWVSWWFGGVFSGLKMILQKKPKIIFSTYPIATAHLIGLTLHKLTRLPWIADFRDSMTEDHYPREIRRRRVFRWIERMTIHNCCRAIFTTPSALEMYRQRYPEIDESVWVLIPNGFNEDIFRQVEETLNSGGASGGDRGSYTDGAKLSSVAPNHTKKSGDDITSPIRPKQSSQITLLHSGVLYPSERDPNPFFRALSSLKREGKIDAERLKIILRATGHDDLYRSTLVQLDISDLVVLSDAIDYRAALLEMFEVDGLLVFQSSGCNHQIPAKIYEYFRAKKPIFSLTDENGDTAAVLKGAGLDDIVPLDDETQIRDGFLAFWQKLQAGSAAVANAAVTEQYSRQYASKRLAEVVESIG